MVNPFKQEQEQIQTGFFLDNKKGLVVFCFVERDDDYDAEGPKVKLYNRLANNANSVGFRLTATNGDISKVEDLIELNVNSIPENIFKDFNWILNNRDLQETFTKFLLEEEKYLFLSLFEDFKVKIVKKDSNVRRE